MASPNQRRQNQGISVINRFVSVYTDNNRFGMPDPGHGAGITSG